MELRVLESYWSTICAAVELGRNEYRSSETAPQGVSSLLFLGRAVAL